MSVTPETGARSSVAAPPDPQQVPLAELVDITKTFGPVVANDGISLSVMPGEVHALLGENGAGKSTLTRILYGLSQPDSGEIRVGGLATRITSPADAMASGIGMVTQEFSLVDTMTVTENLMLAGVGLGRVDVAAAREKVLAAAARIGVSIDPDAIVEDLSVGQRQRVEIVKALFHDCRVLILDEPTAVLVPQDVEQLFDSISRLTSAGMGVIFISHKLHEVTSIADRISILRRGRIVASRPAAGLDPRAIAALMVGAEVSTPAPTNDTDNQAAPTATPAITPDATPGIADAAALQITDLTLETGGSRVLDAVSLTVKPGEILGIAGVSGNGQTELVNVLCGTLTAERGSVMVAQTEIGGLDPAGRIRAGLGRLTEDRKGSVIPALSVAQNLVLEDLDRFTKGPFLNRRAVKDHVNGLIERFDIRAQPGDPVRSLSGGNMQKVLLARAISRGPKALVASQPTRGLDIGACNYVYSQLRALRDDGAGILLISEDLDELLGICDRIAVIYSGRIVGELPAAEATPEALGLLMTGHTSTDYGTAVATRTDERP
ncbi:ABC transporter ATP-binding protein [Homoserinimonas hongtaonis]|nr:ABC transporter ATP-binding protein [Salinibacterium hongtaonis]